MGVVTRYLRLKIAMTELLISKKGCVRHCRAHTLHLNFDKIRVCPGARYMFDVFVARARRGAPLDGLIVPRAQRFSRQKIEPTMRGHAFRLGNLYIFAEV